MLTSNINPYPNARTKPNEPSNPNSPTPTHRNARSASQDRSILNHAQAQFRQHIDPLNGRERQDQHAHARRQHQAQSQSQSQSQSQPQQQQQQQRQRLPPTSVELQPRNHAPTPPRARSSAPHTHSRGSTSSSPRRQSAAPWLMHRLSESGPDSVVDSIEMECSGDACTCVCDGDDGDGGDGDGEGEVQKQTGKAYMQHGERWVRRAGLKRECSVSGKNGWAEE